MPLPQERETFLSITYSYIVWNVIALVFLFFDFFNYSSSLHGMLHKLSYPVLSWVDTSSHTLMRYQYYVKNIGDLLQENQHLKSENLVLKKKMSESQNLERDHIALRQLFKSSRHHQSAYVTLVSRLNVRSALNVSELLIAIQGLQDKIRTEQVILDAQGVVGQIVEVKDHVARVLQITDKRSAIPVEIARNGIRGILMGQGSEQPLKLLNFPKTASVKVGDELLTSGLGGRYPRGYPVARIIEIKDLPSQPSLKINAHPSAALDTNHPLLILEI